MVHHICPRTERPELSLVLENLVSLCDRCHDEAHPEKRGGKTDNVVGFGKSVAETLGIRVEKI